MSLSGATLTSDTGSHSAQSASSDAQTASISPEQEFFLYELETTDSSSLGLVLRAIYDGGDVDRIVHALEKKVRHHDKDISKLCNYHFPGFIDAVKELLQLRAQCKELRSDIETVNSHLVDSSLSLQSKFAQIVKYRKMQRNIANAIDAISLCLPMLEKYAKLTELMENKKYYLALKTLEQLEHTYLPQAQRYRFVQTLSKSVANMRTQIKDASFAQFKDFLELVRTKEGTIGDFALKQAAAYYDMDSEANQKRRKEKAQSLMSPKLVLGGKQTLNQEDQPQEQALKHQEDDTESEMSAQDHIDFSAVYRCDHIFSVLGEKAEFEKYYREQRIKQAHTMLQGPKKTAHVVTYNRLNFNAQAASIAGFIGLFHEIVGFFVVEDTIMQTVPGLVTDDHRNTLWTTAFNHIAKSLENYFKTCTNPHEMLQIKKLLLIVTVTLNSYGYQTEKEIYGLLEGFRDKYFDLLMKESGENFKKVLTSDNYTPMLVKNDAEYQAILARFPFHQKMQEKYPRKMPFSEMVPVIYEQLRAFVRAGLRFMEESNLNQMRVEEIARRKTNVLLEALCECIRQHMAQRGLSLVHLVQITINMFHLERACDTLDQFVSKAVCGGHASGTVGTNTAHLVRLKQDVFRDARSEAEQGIDDELQRKIDTFFELSDYNWDANEATGVASDYIQDLIKFLTSTFQSFTNLPPTLAKHVCMQACKYLSHRLMQFLISAEPRSITMGAIEQLSLDVMQCEVFTQRDLVVGLDEHTLEMTFADLRQILDLFLTEDWTTYNADLGKPDAKYLRVKPQCVCALLEKLIASDKKKSTLFGGVVKTGGSKESDKRKLYEALVKQLRAKMAAPQ